MKPLLRTKILFEQDVVSVRQKTRQIAEFLRFEPQDQNRLATAVSELARNAFQYAGGGEVIFQFDMSNVPQTLYIDVIDQGPGIQNLEHILLGSYVSTTGLGAGLTGSKKLMDHFAIESEFGKGTKIRIGKNLRRSTKAVTVEELAELSEKLFATKPQSTFEEVQLQNRALLMALQELNAKQEELSQLNRELADTNSGVVALYAELDEKAASLTKANEIKTSFLSNMTHEFRTPLSSIISLTRLLLDRLDGDLTTEQERQVKYIFKSADGLLELVNDLLDLAKVEAGKISINPSEFDLETLFSAQRGMFKPLMGPQSKTELIFKTQFYDNIFTDEAKVSQILRNLISNAIKYTDSGSITVEARNDLDGNILFSVTDTGIGIPSDHLETIFEDFSQIESTQQTRSKGTGLGLPLSRRLARLLGGDLWVESTAGRGSTFYARIPQTFEGSTDGLLVAKDSRNGTANHHANSSSKEGKKSPYKVVLIDDDEPSRYLLKGFIRAEINAEFFEAEDGNVGLNHIRTVSPDIVFLDLTMPKKSGFDVIEQWNRECGGKKIPLVVNTARLLTDAEESFLREHGTAILSKDGNRSNTETTDELRKLLATAGLIPENTKAL